MKFSEGHIGMFVQTKAGNNIAYINGIGLNSEGEPIFQIQYASYDTVNCDPCEGYSSWMHPSNLEKVN